MSSITTTISTAALIAVSFLFLQWIPSVSFTFHPFHFNTAKMLVDTTQMPSITTTISTAALIAALFFFLRSFVNEFIYPDLQHYIYSKLSSFIGSFFSQVTLVIEDSFDLEQNELYKAVDHFLPTIINRDSLALKVGLAPGQSGISFRMVNDQRVTDTYRGVAYKWERDGDQDHSYKLSFHKRYRNCAIDNYLPHLVEVWKEMLTEKKTPKLFTLDDGWNSVELDHPATFETLAMDSETETRIKNDLDKFMARKEFYKSFGKAWKRGYLLHGPPGTGKSTLVAAMANYLKLDIYDLDLTNIRHNSDYRRWMLSIPKNSIILVEDIDRHFEPKPAATGTPEHEHEETLGGLLNFVDGLWSSHGDGRIIVFTANNIGGLDSALLRPGRMDMHIPMSYCTREGFRKLALKYSRGQVHDLLSEVEPLIEMTKVTPAEICEQLLKEDDPGIALGGLIEFLEEKKKGRESKAGV